MTSRTLAALAALAVFGGGAAAQEVVTYGYNFGIPGSFTAGPSTGASALVSPGSFTIGNPLGPAPAPISATSVSTGYPGASGGGNIGNAIRLGALDPANSSYFEVTFTPLSGAALTLTDFDFGVRSTPTGGQAYSVRSSLNNYATDLATGAIPNDSTWRLANNTLLPAVAPPGTPLTLRVYAYGGTGNPTPGIITTRLDDVSVTFAVIPVPEPATVLGVAAAGLGLASLARRKLRRDPRPAP
jgi:hypothetical protein